MAAGQSSRAAGPVETAVHLGETDVRIHGRPKGCPQPDGGAASPDSGIFSPTLSTGSTENFWRIFVEIQVAVEAIDRASADEQRGCCSAAIASSGFAPGNRGPDVPVDGNVR